MLNPKKGVFERIEQSLEIFKKNFIAIFAPMFIYKIFTSLIIWNIIYYYWMNYFDFNNLWNSSDINWMLADAFSDTWFVIGVNVFIILILLNLIFVIPFIIATIKSIKQAYEWEIKIDYLKNISYWFKNLSNSFRTYWYMFVYVLLIPALILIFWWLLLIFGQLQNLDNILQIWIFISGFWLILLMFFILYRWYKTTFSITSAVDNDEYSKENFKISVKVSNSNWWRIVWNFILLSILISTVWWITSLIIWIFKISSSDLSFLSLINFQNPQITPETITQIVSSFTKWLGEFSISKFIISFIELFVKLLFLIFTIIFTYIFYKRLELESWISNNNDNNI